MSPPESSVVVSDPLIGTEINGYQVRSVVASGGMGKVYLAVHPLVGAKAAIKVLLPHLTSDAEQIERFVREARVLATLNHERIVKIMGFGSLRDGSHYMIMEHLEGASLARIIEREAPISAARTLVVIDQVLDALAAAHAAGVVHRDLKPMNIVVKSSPTDKKVKLLDFGLARAQSISLAVDGNQALTKASMVMGTPEYIAPEQALGLAPSPASDVYALGVIMFEMLTKRLPFEAKNVSEMVQKHLQSVPPRVSSIVPGVPPALDDLVAQMLSKTPEERGAPAERLRRVVQKILRECQEVEPPGRRSMYATGEFQRPVLPEPSKPSPSAPPPNAPAPPAAPKVDPAWAAAREKAMPSTQRRSPRWLKPALYGLGLVAAAGAGLAYERLNAKGQAAASTHAGPPPPVVPAPEPSPTFPPAPVEPAPPATPPVAEPPVAEPPGAAAAKSARPTTTELCADLGTWKERLPQALNTLSQRYAQLPGARMNPDRPPLSLLTALLEAGRAAEDADGCAEVQREVDQWEASYLKK